MIPFAINHVYVWPPARPSSGALFVYPNVAFQSTFTTQHHTRMKTAVVNAQPTKQPPNIPTCAILSGFD